jgi:alanyl-tRNA synthetase
MGLERTTAVLSGYSSVYDLNFFQVIFRGLESICGMKYDPKADELKDGATLKALIIDPKQKGTKGRYVLQKYTNRSMRIIADHIRSAVFAIADGVVPSNLQQGYVVRRLIRRAIREAYRLGIEGKFCGTIANVIIGEFGEAYRELENKQEKIVFELEREEETFEKTLEKGMKELEKLLKVGEVTGEKAFILYSTYGFPLELTEEIVTERGGSIDREAFRKEFEKHQDLSRTASEGMFKGGLQDDSDMSKKLHTATHLLHAALRKVLGTHVEQKGSNITPKRLRFDFSHPAKMTKEEIKEVEDMVNYAIQKDLPVICEHMDVEKVRDSGALGFFEEKYRNIKGDLSVYQIGDFSKEICGGPHVEHIGELGSFKILKEEASSAGVRRIKAVVG